MAEFRLWGTINHISPSRFVVIVTAVQAGATTAEPITRIASSRQAAEDLRRRLVIEVGAAVAARGDRVIDVEAD